MRNDDFPEFSGKPRTPRALGGSPVTIHLNVPKVDRSWKQAISAGAEVTMPLADQFWGDRHGSLRDPFGHDWSMSSAGKKLTAEEIERGAEAEFQKEPRAGAKATARAATARATTKTAARSSGRRK